MQNRFSFLGSDKGKWRVLSFATVTGAPLSPVEGLDVLADGHTLPPLVEGWTLHGLISNIRYARSAELASLKAIQEPLGRDRARRAALIPIRKNSAWWAMAQDQRRAIFEEDSHHNAIGMAYLPAIARQLYHCRDIGEPFDFLTWFEYAPEHADEFEDLVSRLRGTREWTYVDREVDIRLERS